VKLESKTALITGSAKRVGRAIALELARCGCNIALHYNRSRTEAETLAEDIAKLDRRCCLIHADLADADTWPGVIDASVRAFGTLDILINNAAVFRPMSVATFDVDGWDQTFRVNVTAPTALCHLAAPHLEKSAASKIINLADIAAAKPFAGYIAYSAAKAALVNVTKSLAKSLAPRVQVNAVSPGVAAFPDDFDEEIKTHITSKIPLKTTGSPNDIAGVVRFLCEEGDYITGQVITVDGGLSLS
jgi:pteridine reductase